MRVTRLAVKTIILCLFLSLFLFLDPGRVPKRYDVVVVDVGIVVTVFEKMPKALLIRNG